MLALKLLGLDEVWWLVSPQKPLKPTRDMASFAERFESAQKMAKHPRIRVSDLERRLGSCYTADTLAALTRRFPTTRFVWIMGADNLRQIARWKNWTAIFRTSGTTGSAKRVPVTHQNLVEMARKMQRWLKIGPSDRSTCILPIYYNAGFKATLLVPLLIGCSVAMPATTNPNEFDQWIDELRPTWLTAAPAFLQAVLDRMKARDSAPLKHSLRFVLSTASYLAEAVRVDLQAALGVPVVEFYGLCEAGMMTAPAIPPEKLKPGSVGRPPQGELAIRGDNGKFLPAGQTGQVVLTGPSVTPGYLYDITDTPSGLEDGWLATGDLGVIDTEGYLTIVGRSKDLIISGGYNVYPKEVELVLDELPGVTESAVVGVPHPDFGEGVVAVVIENHTLPSKGQTLIFIVRGRKDNE